MDNPELFWTAMLSRDPARIRAAWESLDRAEQAAVRAHLQRMATEAGWTEPQRLSAQKALDALDDFSSKDE
jgi:hypothetical protein